jgi:hypothetical protein
LYHLEIKSISPSTSPSQLNHHDSKTLQLSSSSQFDQITPLKNKRERQLDLLNLASLTPLQATTPSQQTERERVTGRKQEREATKGDI